MGETVGSLEFAARAMCVEVDPTANRSRSVRKGLGLRADLDAEQSLKHVQEKVARLEHSLSTAQGEAVDLQRALARAELRAEQFQAAADACAEEMRHENLRSRRAEERASAAASSLADVRHESAEQKQVLETRLSLLQAEIDSMRLEWAV